MKQHTFVAASLLVVTLGTAQAAQAEEVGLDFSLSSEPVVATATAQSLSADTATSSPDLESAIANELDFALTPPAVTTSTQPSQSPPKTSSQPSATPAIAAPPPELTSVASDDLFEGGVNSLVAKAVGSAEGTRTPTGDLTPAYYGHVDPGNGVWNLGSFSYQHGAHSPEAADEQQLRRLAKQATIVRQQAAAKGMQLTLEEELNAIDLANQAPLAALDRGGYVDWLEAAHKMGLRGSEAVLWARTRSFLNPDTGQWNAPGLGNNVYSISRDQERRQQSLAKAIALHQPPYQRAETATAPPKAPATAAVPPPTSEELATQIVFFNVDP